MCWTKKCSAGADLTFFMAACSDALVPDPAGVEAISGLAAVGASAFAVGGVLAVTAFAGNGMACVSRFGDSVNAPLAGPGEPILRAFFAASSTDGAAEATTAAPETADAAGAVRDSMAFGARSILSRAKVAESPGSAATRGWARTLPSRLVVGAAGAAVAAGAVGAAGGAEPWPSPELPEPWEED